MADSNEELSLLETLDHLLDRGVVIAGEATISIGDVDLLYLGLNIVLANVDALSRAPRRAQGKLPE
ncbi:MAG: gas vesicle protein [Thermoanaerobaculia bacterium]